MVLALVTDMNVGAELAAARHARGFSLEEIGVRTKVNVERLAAIERNELDQLPPRVYLLGFVRAFAHEVGLQPDEVAQRYLAQFDEDWANEVEASVEEFQPESVALLTTARESAAASDPSAADATSPANAVPLWRPAQFNAPDVARNTPHAPPLRTEDHTDNEGETSVILPPPNDGPSIIPMRLMLPAVVIAVALGVVLSETVYKSPPIGPPSDARTSSAISAGASSANKPESESAPASSDQAGKRAAPDRAAAGDDTPVERPIAADTQDRPESNGITGLWSLTTHVDSSTYDRYRGLTLGYTLQLQQRGNRITGSGQKVSENGQSLQSASRTPITLEGMLNGQRVELKFIERGTLRTSGGTLVMDVGDDGSLRGTFSSDAAQSRGTSQATRVTSAAVNGTPKLDN